MNRKPISPATHGLIDYGLGVMNSVVPQALGLQGAARTIPMAAAAAQGGLNALSNQPFALRKVFPFRMHGKLEALGIPALLVATITTGAWKQPKASLFFGGLFGLLATVYALTDWNAQTGDKEKPGIHLK